jgi:phenylpyruvate tautomerase PptA (4-oxalocrotonate tautomerase family)
MPLARIDLLKGKDAAYRQNVGRVVYEAMIAVGVNDGRTVDQKKVFYKSIVDGLVKAIGIRPEDVLINLIEVRKENWSFRYGIATYAA